MGTLTPISENQPVMPITATPVVEQIVGQPVKKNAPHPVSVTFEYPEKSSRLLALSGILIPIKLLIALPSAIVMFVLALVSGLLIIINYFIVLITGRQNKEFFEIICGYYRWQIRLNAFMAGITDKYPPFSLDN